MFSCQINVTNGTAKDESLPKKKENVKGLAALIDATRISEDPTEGSELYERDARRYGSPSPESLSVNPGPDLWQWKTDTTASFSLLHSATSTTEVGFLGIAFLLFDNICKW